MAVMRVVVTGWSRSVCRLLLLLLLPVVHHQGVVVVGGVVEVVVVNGVVVVVSAGVVVVVGIAELVPSVAGGTLVTAADAAVGPVAEAEDAVVGTMGAAADASELTAADGDASTATTAKAAVVLTSLATMAAVLSAVEEARSSLAKVTSDPGAAREACSSASDINAVRVTKESATPRTTELDTSPDIAKRPSSEDSAVASMGGKVLDGRMSIESSG